ncbi:hypothetical protein [Halorussus caseinilyticus]|uniref:hypothetical protein n=1 Tax=Halorussus caseinilyticus TaxID=3034025 RepID=UPI0023E7AD4D|nr:hypothetical protein [Halorussus sp. DT72]
MYLRSQPHPKDQYKEDVEDLQKDRWNDACGELGPVVSEAYEFVCQAENDHEHTELRDGEKASVILRRVLDDRADLGDLEAKLESIDEPKREYRSCRENRSRALWFFFGGGAGFGVSSAVVWLAPEKTVFTAVEASLITLSLLGVVAGAFVAYHSSSAQTNLDEMVEDKDFM